MSGKTPIEIYEYNKKGQYIRKFNSMSDCRREYFSHIQGKLLLEARNLNIIEKLTKIPRETAWHQLKNNKDYAKEEFVIKYKEE